MTENCKVNPLCSGEGTDLCVQTWNAKKCICKNGFQGEFCDEDIDECDASVENFENPCNGKGQICSNFRGGFECVCQQGFESVEGLDTDESELSCVDIDECANGNHNCANESLCVNTDGAFYCENEDLPVTVEVTTEEVTTSFDGGFTEESTTEDATTQPPTQQPTTKPVRLVTTEPAPIFIDGDCGESNPCNHNNGLGGCDQQCIPLCDETCDCTYQCKCNVGYVLSCDYKSCVAL